MDSSSVPEYTVNVPEPLMLHILSFMHPSAQAWSAKLVNRAARAAFSSQHVSVRRPDLPLWVLQQMYQQHCSTLSTVERKQLLESRAACGDAPGVQWLLTQGCPCSSVACDVAAQGGHLAVLQALRCHSPACPWSEKACNLAAAGGHLGALQYLRTSCPSDPCPWSAFTCSAAARGGHLQVLEWLRQQNPPCPWNAQTSIAAAAEGRLDILEWLCAQRAPFLRFSGVDACYQAALKGHLAVLQFLRAQDPPFQWNERTCWAAAAGGNLEVLQWLRSRQPPCPWLKQDCLAAARIRGFSKECFSKECDAQQVAALIAWIEAADA